MKRESDGEREREKERRKTDKEQKMEEAYAKNVGNKMTKYLIYH